MELLTAHGRGARVRGPGVQRMREVERAVVAFQDAACGRALEMLHDRVDRVAAGGGDASGVETVADDRGEGERVLRRFGKLGESFGDGVGDLTRTAGLERGDGARFAPLLLVPAELMDDVLDEEWVATGDAVDAVLDLARRLLEPE